MMDVSVPTNGSEEQPPSPELLNRRTFLMKVGIALNAAVGLAIATPIVAYLLGPILRRKEYHDWVDIGSVSDYKTGETKLIEFRNPFTEPWDGDTAKVAAYVRLTGDKQFTVFAINCAHLGCPVRWFPESQLFMCPCHGGAYYADGSRASGPPERGLFTYELRVDGNKLLINAGQLPTLSNKASLSPCPGRPSTTSETALVTRIEPCPGTNESTIG